MFRFTGLVLTISPFFFSCNSHLQKKTDRECVLSKLEDSTFFTSVPILGFSSTQSPYLEVNIENQILKMRLDLGFRGNLSTSRAVLDQILNKTFLEKKEMYGMRGKQYIKNVYHLEEASLGAIHFCDFPVHEDNQDFIKDGRFSKDKEAEFLQDDGRIGWELFFQSNLLFDPEHLKVAFCDSIENLKNNGYESIEFIETPLFLERGLVEIDLRTSKGPLRCMIDTGCTWNILNEALPEGKELDVAIWEEDNIVEYSSLKIEGIELGPTCFHRIPIHIPIHIEAILGMEFLENQILFLDFRKEKAYFAKNTNENIYCSENEPPLDDSRDCVEPSEVDHDAAPSIEEAIFQIANDPGAAFGGER